MNIMVTKEMIDAGEKMASDCMDATLQQSFQGLGGSEVLDVSTFDNPDLVEKYLKGDITSVEAMYISMERKRRLAANI
jgi:hypothetical protein